MKIRWYKKYWTPYGKVLGWCLTTFVCGRQIEKHFAKNGRGKFLFYCFVRRTIKHSESDPYIFRSKSWTKTLKALRRDK